MCGFALTAAGVSFWFRAPGSRLAGCVRCGHSQRPVWAPLRSRACHASSAAAIWICSLPGLRTRTSKSSSQSPPTAFNARRLSIYAAGVEPRSRCLICTWRSALFGTLSERVAHQRRNLAQCRHPFVQRLRIDLKEKLSRGGTALGGLHHACSVALKRWNQTSRFSTVSTKSIRLPAQTPESPRADYGWDILRALEELSL